MYLRSLCLMSVLLPAFAVPARLQTDLKATTPGETVPAAPGKAANSAGQANQPQMPPTHLGQDTFKIAIKVRRQCPIRLGGVFLRGLGDTSDACTSGSGTAAGILNTHMTDAKVFNATLSQAKQTEPKLSDANRDWLAANCDTAAFSRTSVTPDTFRVMTRAQPLFTPLLYVYASTLYETDDHKGNAGGWQPAMRAWTLRDVKGNEVPHPDKGAHWMDFGNTAWAAHWQKQVARQVGQYGAQGVLAAELPLGNTFVPDTLQKYKTPADRLKATTQWLRAARSPQQFFLVPSAIGFDSLAGHATLPTPLGTQEPELSGRVWDETYPLVGGAWAEGWVLPYWSGTPLPDAQWELHVEAGDRADRSDQIMIACAAYHNDAELEYVLASFLMSYHAQGRLCLQPMPLRVGQPPNAGYNLAVFRKEIEAKADYFNAPLGAAMQERHMLPVEGGNVWRRQFENGAVYVNSDDTKPRTLYFSGPMRRLDKKTVRQIVLPPHRGVILQNMPDEN